MYACNVQMEIPHTCVQKKRAENETLDFKIM